jgi:hypothetical protein
MKVYAIVSHDAGGAEILSSFIRDNGLRCHYSLTGPAIKIFQNKLGGLENLELQAAVENSELLLCSTSWNSMSEFNSIKIAKSLNLKTIAILDHWVNYRERFIRHGEIILPEEIWVCDEHAYLKACNEFPLQHIRMIGNPYLREIELTYSIYKKNKPNSETRNILYVCEPISEHGVKFYSDANYRGYLEHDAIKYFLQNLKGLRLDNCRIIIRPHPSESLEKYQWVLNEYKYNVILSNNFHLVEDIMQSTHIFGCDSMALVAGLVCGKKVYSCIPPHGMKMSIPYSGIIKLNEV